MEDNIIKIDYDNINVEEIMKQIRDNIRKRNYSMEELESLQKNLNISYSEGDFNIAELAHNVALNNTHWSIQTANYIKSDRRLIGPLIVLGKRAVRKLSYWYVQNLFTQQTEFNASITNSINAIDRYIKSAINSMDEMPKAFARKIKLIEEDKRKLVERIENLEEAKIKLNEKVENLEEARLKLNEKVENLEEARIELNERIENLEEDRKKLNEKVENLEEDKVKLNEKVENLDEKVLSLYEKTRHMDEIANAFKEILIYEEENKRQYENIKSQVEENGRIEEITANRLRRIERSIKYNCDDISKTQKIEINHPESIDMDYFLFESKYRGSNAEIKNRQNVYLEYFKDKTNVLDIGCGRGEFVELLLENSIGVVGIDINRDNINYCADKGLPVKYAEALEYLQHCDNSSLGGVFMAQVAEHLETNDFITLIRLVRKKLQVGAYFIVETINPQSLIVFTESYFMDPSHTKMIHPLTMKFLIETEGFSSIKLLYLSPVEEKHKLPAIICEDNYKNFESFNSAVSRLNDLIYGCRDYAVIAKR